MTVLRPGFEVLVCVHNSPEDVRRCLASVQRTLGPSDRLLVVDDGSDAPARHVCEEAAARDPARTRLIRRPEGSGFCRAANAGLRERSAEFVVVLNSDTVVTDGWLDRLHACFAQAEEIGIVGPLSNAGVWQSIPEFATGGPTANIIRDDDATLGAIAAFCAGFGERYPSPFVDQINGFCFAIRSGVLSTVGLFDEESFPRGYGEEVDFVFRAMEAGFLCAVSVYCFVYHAKTKSYSRKQRCNHVREGRYRLLSRYGSDRLDRATKSTQHHPVLAAIREEAREAFVRNGWMV